MGVESLFPSSSSTHSWQWDNWESAITAPHSLTRRRAKNCLLRDNSRQSLHMQYPVQQAGHYYSLRPPQGHAVHSWDGTELHFWLYMHCISAAQTANNNIPHSSNNLYTGQGTREIGLSIQLENRSGRRSCVWCRFETPSQTLIFLKLHHTCPTAALQRDWLTVNVITRNRPSLCQSDETGPVSPRT